MSLLLPAHARNVSSWCCGGHTMHNICTGQKRRGCEGMVKIEGCRTRSLRNTLPHTNNNRECHTGNQSRHAFQIFKDIQASRGNNKRLSQPLQKPPP